MSNASDRQLEEARRAWSLGALWVGAFNGEAKYRMRWWDGHMNREVAGDIPRRQDVAVIMRLQPSRPPATTLAAHWRPEIFGEEKLAAQQLFALCGLIAREAAVRDQSARTLYRRWVRRRPDLAIGSYLPRLVG